MELISILVIIVVPVVLFMYASFLLGRRVALAEIKKHVKAEKQKQSHPPLPDDMGKILMIAAMREYGGSFVVELADCFERADSINYRKLCHTFPEYVGQYLEIGKKEYKPIGKESVT